MTFSTAPGEPLRLNSDQDECLKSPVDDPHLPAGRYKFGTSRFCRQRSESAHRCPLRVPFRLSFLNQFSLRMQSIIRLSA